MGTVTPEELLRLYTLEQITLEQAMGYALQNLVRMQAMLESLSETQFDVERLKAFTGMEERKGKKKEKREDQGKTSEV
jgi:hypothetical protein